LNTYGYLQVTNCPSSSDIVCRYVHFQHEDPTETYVWWYQKDNLYPPCTGTFPPVGTACCGYNDDADCCNTGPGHDPDDCASGWYQEDGWPASENQKKIIQDGDSPALIDAPVGQNAEGCTYGDGYKWLDGIWNETAPGSETYTRYFWNTSSSPNFIDDTQTTTKLSRCVLAVFHRQKWWTRDAAESGTYNSLTRADVDGGTLTDRNAADDRTPQYWLWSSAGVVLTGFQVMASSLSTAQKDTLFEAIHLDEPIPKAITDILEADGILGDPSDPGGGIEQPWEITLTYTSGNTDTLRTFARSGGWTFVCHDFHATPTAYLETYWPQLPFRFSTSSNFGDSCLTAAPIPGNGCACSSSGGSCDPCGVTPRGCSEDPSPICGSSLSEPCDGDIVIGNCVFGVVMFYYAYQLQIPSATYSTPYGCICNLAYLWRYEADEEPTDPYDQAPRDLSIAPPRANLTHLMPFSVSRAIRVSDSPDNTCCGGEGIFKGVADAIRCPSETPQGANCDDDSCS
tara:strand:+ start:10415 stop:11950 length:1536 start_codon:yes stop_codon:yes gene_type:complete